MNYKVLQLHCSTKIISIKTYRDQNIKKFNVTEHASHSEKVVCTFRNVQNLIMCLIQNITNNMIWFLHHFVYWYDQIVLYFNHVTCMISFLITIIYNLVPMNERPICHFVCEVRQTLSIIVNVLTKINYSTLFPHHITHEVKIFAPSLHFTIDHHVMHLSNHNNILPRSLIW